MKITYESIRRVPHVESGVIDKRYWRMLHEKHKDILSYIMDDEPGTEAAAYYSLDLHEITKYKGKPGAGEVYPKTIIMPHIFIHNHPDGNGFSLNDIRPFLMNPSTAGMSAVGNNGTLFTLEKTDEFEAANALHRYAHAISNAPDPFSDYDNYLMFVENYYRELQDCGFIYRKVVPK